MFIANSLQNSNKGCIETVISYNFIQDFFLQNSNKSCIETSTYKDDRVKVKNRTVTRVVLKQQDDRPSFSWRLDRTVTRVVLKHIEGLYEIAA